MENNQKVNRYAVIDMGTNTCNLLIADILTNGSFVPVYDRKLPVKLGRGGIHKDILLTEAIDRGILALQSHSKTVMEYGVDKLKIVGTSALRGAANSDELLNKVKELFGWKIEIIDGEEEAELIFRGVRLSLPDGIGNYLILDIGGGSIEFIVANNDTVIWKKSFNIGIARALEAIPTSDPISQSEISSLEKWFDAHLAELWQVCRQYKPLTLVGCSGAFDTFVDIYEKAIPDQKIRSVSELPLKEYYKIHNLLIHSNHQSRSKIQGMDGMRVEMVVIASVFTNFILQRCSFQKLLHTHNSLKEGIMNRFITKG